MENNILQGDNLNVDCELRKTLNRQKIKKDESLLIVQGKNGLKDSFFESDSKGKIMDINEIDSLEKIKPGDLGQIYFYEELRKVTGIINVWCSLDILPDLNDYLRGECDNFTRSVFEEKIMNFSDSMQAVIDNLENLKERIDKLLLLVLEEI
ncbi:MAG: hypothetical protein NTX22_17010 [Ignavibacteriales bacterium]|nr:hypothetical protein [Ignavibacteriales bacterium]